MKLSLKMVVVLLSGLGTLNACDCGAGGVPPGTDAGDRVDAAQTGDAASFDARLANSAPQAQGQSLSTNEDQTLDITLDGSDVDGDALSFVLTDAPLHGLLTGTAPDLTYTPDADYNGSDGLSYYVDDGLAQSAVVTVAIEIRPQPDEPVAQGQSLATDEDSALALELIASDVDGDPLSFAITAPPLNGSLSGTPPHLVFMPDPDFNGQDSFGFTASDGTLESTRAMVTLTVRPVNDAPVAVDGQISGIEDTALSLLLDATDVDGDSLTFTVMTQPQHGTLNGTPPALVYTPALDYMGSDSLIFRASDGQLDSNLATLRIQVQPSADRPTALPQALQTDEDLALPITLAGMDPENDPLTFVIVNPPSHGSISGTLPAITYTPAADFFGRDDFGFTVNDGSLDSAMAVVSVDVLARQDAPVAVADSYHIDEDSLLTVDASLGVLNNDIDVDGDVLQANLDQAPAKGTLQLAAAGGFSYDPRGVFDHLKAGDIETVTFVYRASDGISAPSSVSVTLTIEGLNDDPISQADSYSTDEDSVLTVAAVNGVLANDSDVESDSLTANLASPPSQGVVTLGLDGSLTYDPAGAFESLRTGDNRQVSFSYTLLDGHGGQVNGSVTLTINGVNDNPVAVDDSYSIGEDQLLSVAAAGGVLANDSDAEGDNLSASLVSHNGGGSLTLDADGGLQFDPRGSFDDLATGQSRAVTIIYSVSDGNGTPVTATLIITVTGLNDDPVVTGDSYTTDEDSLLTVAASAGVLANDTDVDNATLTASLVTGPSRGALSLGPDGAFSFDPRGDFESLADGASSQVSFSYQVDDGAGGVAQGSVTLTIDGVNDSPVAQDDSFSLNEDNPLVVGAAGGVLVNDSDVDGDGLSAGLVSMSGGGVLNLASDGGFTFDPDGQFESLAAGASTQVSFTYQASDGHGGSSQAVATMTINGQNDAPVAQNDAFVTDEDSPLTVLPAAGVLANDSDIDGDGLNVELISAPAGGVFTLNTDGSLSFDPDGQFELLTVGQTQVLSFSYRILDPSGASDQASATITVQGINDQPTAVADSYSTMGNTAILIDAASGLLINDSDVETPGGGLGTLPETKATTLGGDVTIGVDGGFTYSPAPGQRSATDTFTYTLDDGDGGQVVGQVSITISADMVWYVDNQGIAPGDGRSSTPFVRLKAAEGPSSAGDTIWVRSGDGTSGEYNEGLVLQANQRLLGQGVDLVMASVVVEAAGLRTLIANTAGHALVLASGVAIDGLDIDFASADGLHADGLAGSLDVASMAVANTDGHAVSIRNSSATFNLGALAITGSGGPGAIGHGLDLESNSGLVDIASLSVQTDNGAGIRALNGGILDIGNASTAIDATGGPALDLENTTGRVAGVAGWQLASLISSGSASTGVRLVNLGDTFNLVGKLTVTGPQGHAVFLDTLPAQMRLANVDLQAPNGFAFKVTDVSDAQVPAGVVSGITGASDAGAIDLLRSTVDIHLSSVVVGAALYGLRANQGSGTVLIDSYIHSNGLGSSVDLTSSTLTVTLTAGAISSPAGGAVLINGGSATLTVGSSITLSQGYVLDAANTTAGVVTLGAGGIIVSGGTGVRLSAARGTYNINGGSYAGVSNNAGAVVDLIGSCGSVNVNALSIDSGLSAGVKASNFSGSLTISGGQINANTRAVDAAFTGGGNLVVTGVGSSRYATDAIYLLLDTTAAVGFDVNNNDMSLPVLNAAAQGVHVQTASGASGEFRGRIENNTFNKVAQAVWVQSDNSDVVLTDPLLSNTYETNGVPPVVLRGINGGHVTLDADLATVALDDIVYDAQLYGADVANRSTVLPFDYQNIAGTLHFTTSLAAYTNGVAALQLDGINSSEFTLRTDTAVFDTVGAVGLVISDATLDMQVSSFVVDGNGTASTSLQLINVTGLLRVNDAVSLSATTGSCLDISNVGADLDLGYTTNAAISISGCGARAVDLHDNTDVNSILGLGATSLDSQVLPMLRVASNTAGLLRTRTLTLSNPGGLTGAQVVLNSNGSATTQQLAALHLTNAQSGGLSTNTHKGATTISQLQITGTGDSGLSAIDSAVSPNAITVPAGGGSFINMASGRAIYVSGAKMDLHLQYINASSTASGVSFFNGGTLDVTGDAGGTAGSGGTIQNTTQYGVEASNVAGLTLRHMNFTNTAINSNSACQDALTGSVSNCHAAIALSYATDPVFDDLLINGSSQNGIVFDEVYGSTLSNSTLQGIGNEAHETAIALAGCANTHTFSGLTVGVNADGNQRNLVVRQDRNNLTLNVSNSTFKYAVANSVAMRSEANHQITASIDGQAISNNGDSAVVVDSFNTSRVDLTLNNIALTDNNSTLSTQATVQLRNHDASSLTVDLSASVLSSETTGRLFSATQPNDGGGGTGTLRVTLAGNTFSSVGTGTVPPSGRFIEIMGDNQGTVYSLVDNNVINYYFRVDTALHISSNSQADVHSTVRANAITVETGTFAWAVRGAEFIASGVNGRHCLNLGVPGFPGDQLFLDPSWPRDALYIDKQGNGAFKLDGLGVAFDTFPFFNVHAWVNNRSTSTQTQVAATGSPQQFVVGACTLP